MKEHFKFFANHSPKLLKKKQGGSHSPLKKHVSSQNKACDKTRAGNNKSNVGMS